MACESQGIDLSELDWSNIINPELILIICCSMTVFTVLFHLLYLTIVPLFLYPYYMHLQNCEISHLLIVDKSCSILHGLTLIILCISLVNPFIVSFNDCHIYGKTTLEQEIISCISIGYFIYDSIIVSIIYRVKLKEKIDIENILHHIVTIMGLYVCIIAVYSGYIVIFAIYWSEILGPFNHAATIKYKLLQQNNITFTFIIIKILNICLYIITRFILIGYCSVQLFVIYSEVLIMYKIMAILLMIVSLGLLYVMLKELQTICHQYKVNKITKSNPSTEGPELTSTL